MLVVTPDFPPGPGGIQILAERVTAGLAGMEPRVVTIDAQSAAAFDATRPYRVVRSRRLPTRLLSNVVLSVRTLGEALRMRPDVVLVVHLVCAPAAWAVRALLPGHPPFALYLHADEMTARRRLTRRALRTADVAIAVSDYTRRLARDAGAPSRRLRCIPPGVDLPGPTRVTRDDRPTVLTVARLTDRYKGHDVMIRAMALVRESVPEARWVVVGDGALRGELEAAAREHGVADAVTFTGALSDVERDAWLDRAHVFAMPSRLPPTRSGGEGFGIVYLEAAAHGLPVVAGNVAGALDAVQDDETGLLVDPSDAGAVAGALVALLTDPHRARAMGEAGARRAEEFAWPLIAERVREVLLGLGEQSPVR